MKKSLFILIATLAVAAIFVCTQARGQEYSASAPIPVGSTRAQVDSGPPIKTNATNAKFFTHPKGPVDDRNFHNTQVNFLDGTIVDVKDIAAAPGLLRNPVAELPGLGDALSRGGMLDDMQREEALGAPNIIQPTHGFCPEEFFFRMSTSTFTLGLGLNFQCDVLSDVEYVDASGTTVRVKNTTDHQYEVADIRNTADGTDAEFDALFGTTGLLHEAGLIGDAEEGLTPYDPASLYPATIISPDKFAYKAKSVTSIANIEEPLIHNYAYGIASVDEEGGNGGLVSAIYDPVNVEKRLKESLIVDMAFVGPTPDIHLVLGRDVKTDERPYGILKLHPSPLVSFRKDIEKNRMRLAGYLSWQLHNIDFSHPEELPLFALKLFLSINLNPIDVEAIKSGDKIRLATINAGTLGSVEQFFRDGKGLPLDFDTDPATVTNYKWRELLAAESSPITGLPSSGIPGEVYYPHTNASYIVFNEKITPWINDLSNRRTDNPNEIFDPVLSRPGAKIAGFALVGPGMFDGAVGTDVIAGVEKQFLIVPSGEKAADGNYYVYKFSPDDAEKLYLNVKRVSATSSNIPIGIAGEPYQVETPDGFVPYEAALGDLNGDGFADMALTFRGAQTIWGEDNDTAGTDWFDNHEGDQVHFNKSPYTAPGNEMFSNCVYIYYSQLSGTKVIFPNSIADQMICLESSATDAKWQIAGGIAISDMNNDGRNDLIVGNLNPMFIAGSDPKAYTSYAAIFWNTESLPSGDFFTDTPNKTVQVGFNKTTAGPRTDIDDAGQYLINVWGGGDGLFGVSDLDIDVVNKNILATSGAPLMLAPFGCPKFSSDKTDTDVESWLELAWSLFYNRKNPGVSWRLAPPDKHDVVPMRCLASAGTTPTPTIEAYMPTPTYTYTRTCRVADVPPDAGLGNCSCNSLAWDCTEMTTRCCVACDTDAERTGYPLFCNTVETCCPAGQQCCTTGCCPTTKLDTMKKELFADGRGGDSGSGDGGGSDFAKCDKVYDSKAPFIAQIGDLKLAQTEKNLTATGANQQISKNISPYAGLWDQMNKFLVEEAKLTDEQAADVVKQMKQSVSKGSNKFLFEELILPFAEAVMDLMIPAKEVESQQKEQSSKNFWKRFSLINEAMANPISEPDGIWILYNPGTTSTPFSAYQSNFRMPRGHDPAFPEKREITVILKKTPPPPIIGLCGNGAYDPGEECGESSIPDLKCRDDLGFTCDTTYCQCVPPTCGNNLVDTSTGEGCDLVAGVPTGCAEGQLCLRTCHCYTPTTTTIPGETVPGTVEEGIPGAPTIVTKCSTFSSPAIESYFNDLNEKARKSLPGLKTSDLFCEAEGMVEASILVPGADKGVGAIIQRNGSLPEDFTQWTELKGTANIATKPIKLLPSDSARAMRVETPDLSQAVTGLSESVTPLSSYIEANVNVGENVYTLNNVLSWEMSTDLTKQVGVEVVVNKIYNRVQPLMKSWSVSGESDAFLKENSFANYDMEQVLSQLSANASLCHDGYCELKAVKGLWPDYQTYSLMLVQGMKSTRAGITLPPVKVEFVNLGTPSAKAMGGGPSCKCDMTAQAPDALSVVALLILTFVVTGGFVAVRILNSPSFVRRGKGR